MKVTLNFICDIISMWIGPLQGLKSIEILANLFDRLCSIKIGSSEFQVGQN